MRVTAILVALAALLAGCVSVPSEVDPQAALGAAAFLDPIVDDHDHGLFSEHNFSTSTMSLVGWTPMGEDRKPYSYIGEMDTYGNLTVVQVLGRGSMPGFVVIDTTDPANPTPVGRADMPFSYVVDVKWSPDGKYVFAASQVGPQRTRTHASPAEDPVFAALTGNGFTQWDMSDPTQPVAIAGGLSEPTGCHMLSVKEMGGELYVFCVANVVKVYAYAGEGAWTEVAVMGPGTTGEGLDRVVAETVGAGANAANALLLGAEPHDLTIQEDPLEHGRFIASVSYWDFGLRFFDVTDPTSPVELGAWGGQGAEVYEGNVHGAMLYGHHGKERLAVVGPELLGSTHPALWVLDVTDFANPKIVGEWVPPGAHVSQGLLLTTHQFQVVNERIYLAYNHAGVWVLDLHTILEGGYESDPARPDVLGYYLPHQEVELFNPEVAAVPNTWDVNVKDGRIFASDRYTGFYVLQFEGDTPGDAAITSVG